MAIDRLAVYTAVYPGVEKYLASWYRSVLSQTDKEFDLWISLDSLTPDQFNASVKIEQTNIYFIACDDNLTPAQIRQDALKMLVEQYPAIVLVDSDDLLYPARVESARKALQHYDMVGCSLRIINEGGQDLGLAFGPPAEADLESLLLRYNIYGLSNTAYRSALLRQCLPIPDDCVCIDWLLATRASAKGARLHFDREAGMAYRQYSANTARVLPPFTRETVIKATERVLNHYRCALRADWQLPIARRTGIEAARDRAQSFHASITESPITLNRYIEALNRITPLFIWWWCVAHPSLEEIWKN